MIGEFSEIELRALLRSETGAIVEVVEQMLERIGPGIRVLGESLEDAQVALGGVELFQIAFDHGELVVALRGIVADFYKAAEKFGGFGETFGRDPEICELDESVGEIGIGLERLLEILFRFGLIALAAFDVADVEEAGCIVRVELETLFEILAGFVEAAEVTIGEAEKSVRARGRIDCDEMIKFFDGFFRAAGHEITFAERSVEIGARRSELYARFKERNCVLEIVLAHADAAEEIDDVKIFGREFVGADEQFECVDWARLIVIDLGEEVKRVGRIGLEGLRAFGDEFGIRKISGAKIGLREIEKDVEVLGLERVGLFEFRLGGFVLFGRRENYAEREMELDVVWSADRKSRRNFLRLHRAAGLEAGAEEIELGFGGGGRDAFEKRNRGGRLVFGEKDEAEIVICF